MNLATKIFPLETRFAMSDPKPRKTSGRKTTRPRAGASAGGEGPNAAGTSDETAAAAAMPQSNEFRTSEEPVLAIQQVPGADSATANQSADPYASDSFGGSDGLDSEIRRRAYEIYLARGQAEGNDLSDWLEAERLVRSRRDTAERAVQAAQPSTD
jgi:hypothetical protein